MGKFDVFDHFWHFSDSPPSVAIQCLETTFKISSSDGHLAVSQPLREIFLNALLKVGSAEHINTFTDVSVKEKSNKE